MTFDAFEAGDVGHGEAERYSAGQEDVDDQLQYEQVRYSTSRYRHVRCRQGANSVTVLISLVHFPTLT